MNYTRGVYYEEIKKPDVSVSDRYKKTSKPPVETKTETVITGMNFDAFKEINIPLEIQEPTPKPQTTRRKSNNNSVNTTGLVTNDNDNDKYSATEPYMKKYAETNNLLKNAITQLDIGLSEMQNDMTMLRNNKTLRNKYQSMSMIQKNMGDFLGNKINAIKELNSVISKCNDLELRRAKELKELDAQDDDKRIMDLYNAMISMPVGGQNGMIGGFSTPLGPNTFEMTYAGNPSMPTRNVVTSIDGQDQGDVGYMNYLRNKTPAQNMMSLDSNPNVQQVVVHNRATGQSYFEIMDMTTMRPVPNTDKYDNSFLEDTHLDFVNNIATNVNIGESYPIVQIGGDPILNEY